MTDSHDTQRRSRFAPTAQEFAVDAGRPGRARRSDLETGVSCLQPYADATMRATVLAKMDKH